MWPWVFCAPRTPFKTLFLLFHFYVSIFLCTTRGIITLFFFGFSRLQFLTIILQFTQKLLSWVCAALCFLCPCMILQPLSPTIHTPQHAHILKSTFMHLPSVVTYNVDQHLSSSKNNLLIGHNLGEIGEEKVDKYCHYTRQVSAWL